MNEYIVNEDVAHRQMSISATLQAPVELVWKVWTHPVHIANWWGPDGFTNIIHTMEVTNGGEWRLTMQGPDGKRYPNKSTFVEIVEYKKIVFRHFNPSYIATIVFTAKEEETVLDWAMQFETRELFETVVKVFKADEGLKQNVEKLTAYIETQL